MGGITPILYQTAIPVFADVDPRTYNVTAATIEEKITRRTRAVIVTHLFGTSCDMDPILELCREDARRRRNERELRRDFGDIHMELERAALAMEHARRYSDQKSAAQRNDEGDTPDPA